MKKISVNIWLNNSNDVSLFKEQVKKDVEEIRKAPCVEKVEFHIEEVQE